MRNEFIAFTIISLLLVGLISFFVWPPFWFALIPLLPLLLLGWYDMFQRKHAIMRNFPILGRGRYLMEKLRPGVQQYFIESDTEGKPFDRQNRSIIYQRAKDVLDTTPFGTQLDVYAEGYEWMEHSIASIDPHKIDQDPRTIVGGPACTQKYPASLFNVSAMSFGSLSSAAIEALNGGAKIGGFAHNTGEGGISPYHKKFGGDLIYQIGTGYFGCRSQDDRIDWDEYVKRCEEPSVKMIELKLSQGAKPGHGGILPAKKVTKEIAEIRGIEMGKDVLSPPYHREFSTPEGLLETIKKMQDLSGGKPVGFKLCVGSVREFFAICKAMIKTGIRPDFIAVDGGEGGTGAAPLEFSNSVGMPFKEGLAFIYDALVGFDLKKDIKIFAAGKVVTGFHIFRALALGADACYSARAMMMAVGCIQALECNNNHCPTGVATQDPELVAGLNVEDKKDRVANYHTETIHSFVELMAAAGIDEHEKIKRSHINRRISMNTIKRYDEIYPYVEKGAFLNVGTCPEKYKRSLAEASAESFGVVEVIK